MPDIDVDIDGIGSLQAALEERVDDLEVTTEWVAGTAVEYAIYLEFGTRDMDPKSFVRPAALVYQRSLRSAIAADTETTLDAIDDADTLVRVVALGLERRIKKIITAKGLIETGTLRASVKAVPANQVNSLPDADEIDVGDEPVAETTREIST